MVPLRSLVIQEPPDVSTCNFHVFGSGFQVNRILESDSDLMLPKNTGPVFSKNGDILVAAADSEGTSNSPFIRLLFNASNEEFTEVGRISDPTNGYEILNLFPSGQNEVCVITGHPEQSRRCLFFIQVPFQVASIQEFLNY